MGAVRARAGGASTSRSCACRCAPAPWTRAAREVATPKAKRMRARCSKRCCEAALERRLHRPTRWSPTSLAQSHALWHMRESIPLAQAEEGPEHQARHRAAGVAHRRVRRRDRRRAAARAFPACGWSTSATSATATCTTTCRRPTGGDAARFLREHEDRGQRAGLRRGRSASAARSRPSTASARSSATSWRSTSRRWRWR